MVVVARMGDAGYRQFRIPALGLTSTGRLLAVFDGRPDVDDLPGPIDLVCCHSDDGGLTWSAPRVLRSGAGAQGFGDPSVFGDVGDGRILVLHEATTSRGFFEDEPGSDPGDERHAHVDVAVSDDDGITWSFRRITDMVKSAAVEAIFAASGTGCRVPSGPFAGRLVQPFVQRVGRDISARLAWSDDRGATWQVGGVVPGGNESSVAGLGDGRLIVSSRATPHRLTGWSGDGGATVQCHPDEQLPDPSDNGSVVALASGAVVCSYNHDRHFRRNLVLRRSPDAGVTWPQAVVIESDSAAYSTTVQLPDGTIGVLYERAGYSEIAFTRVSEDDFRPVDEVLLRRADLDVTLVWRLVRPSAESVVRAVLVTDGDGGHGSAGSGDGGRETVDLLRTREGFARFAAPGPGLAVGTRLLFTARVTDAGAALEDLVIEFGGSGRTESLTVRRVEPRQSVLVNFYCAVTPEDVARGSLSASVRVTGRSRGGTEKAESSLVVSTSDARVLRSGPTG